MKPSYVMVVSAVVYAVLGLALLFAAGTVLGLYGGMSMEPVTEHLVGGGLIGFAVLNALAVRESGGPAQSTVVANLVFNAIGFVVVVQQMLSGGPNSLGWVTAGISLLLAVDFAYVLLMGQGSQVRARA